MKLYRVSAPGKKKTWLGTQAETAAYRKTLVSDEKIPRSAISTDEIDVPTKKEELLAWLNAQED